jgi:diguanylate cyclase (GGDEF)-like protein
VARDTDTIVDQTLTEMTRELNLSGRQPCLVVLAGTEAGRVIPLVVGDQAIGRTNEATIVLPQSGVSRAHAELIVHSPDEVYIRDLGSTNGTRVNGDPISDKPLRLNVDDRIRLSKRVLLKFSLQDELESKMQAELYSSAMRDGLTGAFNKRFLLDRMEQEFAHAKRHGTPLALLVMDLDHFKKVNDTFGHSAGDQVLVTTAELIQANLRAGDLFARYGGEEFVLLMRETGLQSAVQVANRIRSGLMEEETIFEGTPIRCTMSIGVTAMPPVHVASAMDFFVRGDRLLYQAKRIGRNRVCAEGPKED